MAWTTARTLYAVAPRDYDLIIGSGGAPTVATRSTHAEAIRTDASDAASLRYVTVDSGTTWARASSVATVAVAASGTGVVATSERLETRTLTLTLTNTPVVLADEAGVVAYGSLKIADMPEGAILFAGAALDLDLTRSSAGVNDDWDGDIALGTAAAGNDATLTGTEANLIASTATPQASGGATTGNAHSATAQACTVVDGTATAVDLYLNVLVDDADHDVTSTACNIIANGTIKVTYAMLGDY